jgi:hypothetical protein
MYPDRGAFVSQSANSGFGYTAIHKHRFFDLCGEEAWRLVAPLGCEPAKKKDRSLRQLLHELAQAAIF